MTRLDESIGEFPVTSTGLPDGTRPIVPVAPAATIRRPPAPAVATPVTGGTNWPANPAVNGQPPRRKSRVGVGLAAAAALVIVVLVAFAMTSSRTTTAGPTPPPTTTPISTAADPMSVPNSEPPVPKSEAPTTFASVPISPRLVDVPTTAENGTDDAGNPISYDSSNLYDGDPATCWRMNGDGTGRTITIDLGTSMTVTTVGLIPGYAKQDPKTGVDRFMQNRRVATVTWSSDDGKTVSQAFVNSPSMQTVQMPSVTRYLRVTIGAVTSHDGRDFTAISEIGIVGHQ
jgi:hypothetical protein